MSSAVEGLLQRLHLPGAVERARELGIDKIITLRNLPDDKLRELAGGDEEYNRLVQAIKTRSNAAGHDARPGAPTSRYPEEGMHNEGGGRSRGHGRWRGGSNSKGRGGRGGGGDHGGNGDDRAVEGGRHRLHSEHMLAFNEPVEVPFDSMRWLMGRKAANLLAIHREFGTTNSEIPRPESVSATRQFLIYGPTKEAVHYAKREVLRLAGVLSQEQREARYEYNLHELDHNLKSVTTACAANILNKGKPVHLSEAVMRRLVGTFRFVEPNNIQHFTISGKLSDKAKFDLLSECCKMLEGAQMIVFAAPDRVKDIAHGHRCQRALGVNKVSFLSPEIDKAERMADLELFKQGEPNEKGVRQRVLVSTNDYGKLARRVPIPYVNVVVHFTVPRSRELFLLQSKCCGRQATPGISILFIPEENVEFRMLIEDDFKPVEYSKEAFAEAAAKLVYDTVSEPLTGEDADPPPDWREVMAREAAEKAEKKKQKEMEREARKKVAGGDATPAS